SPACRSACPDSCSAASAARCSASRRGSESFEPAALRAGALAGGMAVFVFGYITYRYLDDLRAWLALGSVIALVRVPLLKSDHLRRAIVVLAILLTAYSVWTNFAFA